MSKKVEKLVKTVFVYDEDGFFEDTHIAQVNPKRPGAYLMPPRCTLVKPDLKPKFFYKIKTVGDENSGWDEIPFPQSAADFVGVEIPHKSRTLHNHMLRSLLSDYVKKDPEHFREVAVNDKNGDKIATTVEAIPELTEAEKKAQKEAAARSTRDYYLAMTDYLVVNDYPITNEEREQVLEYRQALRDIPQARAFPEGIVWPEPPAVAKAAHKYWKSAQVGAEIKKRIEAIQARTDLDEEQKTKLTAALQQVYQQSGYPYDIEWPVEEEVLANE
ncbi:tail fiber assembly protein [Parasutterella sp.]|uniref:tail fiber assembly protein n=1 Tax=Parasutterella sp. TaxID=2049037 RepID=UPI00352259D4